MGVLQDVTAMMFIGQYVNLMNYHRDMLTYNTLKAEDQKAQTAVVS